MNVQHNSACLFDTKPHTIKTEEGEGDCSYVCAGYAVNNYKLSRCIGIVVDVLLIENSLHKEWTRINMKD